jgi:regulatory protein
MPADRSRTARKPRPLDPARLEELALGYVARFATSAAKLESYLIRKVRERGWDGEQAADPASIAGRFVELGYLDDEAYARAKSGGLLRRGYGPRRVSQVLNAAGIAEEVRDEVRAGEGAERGAAVTLAARRRFGPWGGPAHREARQKQLSAMLRAGHGFDVARAVIDAPSVTAAEEWAAEADPDSEETV